ncbi:AraC-type DNA-binding protein [Evansella caseinilytica]|uniref:AraC-type DNA-binding protein n=1 Tax=Evansella caseinilytica TaxID=1503961 RepID=A0A1H3U4C0_9BACI|nr:AraC family transcriptional regulator [Evansella caseinilytica]SDZ57313.1 AraC-type DNA-binding protein [Evansella caseinilytica]
MNDKQLDQLLRKYTDSENFYQEYPNALSPRYQSMKKVKVRGHLVYRFKPSSVNESGIVISKDSRFTSVPPYVHTNVNMNYIYSGKCTYIVDEKTITLREGDVCIFDTDVIRTKKKIGENDIVMNISMSNDFLSSQFLNRLAQQSIVSSFILSAISNGKNHDNFLIFRTKGKKKIKHLFADLLCEYYDLRMYSREIINSYLVIIFTELLRIYQDDSAHQKIQLSNDSSGNIVDILRYLEKEYLHCTLSSLAKQFGYHPKYLSHLIKEKTGKTFKELQLSLKLKLACNYLVNTSLSIQEIAEKVRISNLNSFYQKFGSTYKMTPKSYRDTFGNNS